MSGTPHDQGGGKALLVAEQVRKVYRTGEIEVEALVGLDLTVHRASWSRSWVRPGQGRPPC
jgi:hypothetical protein